MSIFGKIMGAIFGTSTANAATTGAAGTTGATAAPAGGTATTMAAVDVEKVVSEMAAQKKEKLDWRKSIVDLMKVLDLDSGLGARKELAKELGYTGDMNDSAKMNIWLHKQVMNKLAANGGKVPADLRD
jgi:dihydroorotase-like cyclic amidohydrolase